MNGTITDSPSSPGSVAQDVGNSGLPEWYRELQSHAWKDYESTPAPTRSDEAWRFANLKQLELGGFQRAPRLAEIEESALIERSNRLEDRAGRYVFANECLAAAEAPEGEGLICLPLNEAVSKHEKLMQEHFMTQEATLGSAKYALLHKSRTVSGLFLYVPANMEIALPIEVYHWIAGDHASMYPHTLIVTGENAKVTVIDHFQSAEASESAFSCGVVDLVAGRGSQIRYVACQWLSRTSSSMQISSTLASADADVKSLQVQLGSQWVRTESVSHLTGKGANSDMLSVSVPAGDQEVDQRTLQHHAEPHTTSDLLYKNALYDQGRSIFAGLIMVDEGAHYTDAYQTCRNLLLSDDAEANAMPGLEINADQVKCSHGSTSGPITDDEIFYFKARGIPAEKARQLITFGFTAEVLQKLGDEAVETLVRRLLEERFDQLS